MQNRPSLHPARHARRSGRRLPASLGTGIALAPVLLSFGCVQAPPPVDITALTPPVRTAPPEKAAKVRAESLAGAGLEPLASPQQVINSVSLGRRDPFGQLLPSFLPLGPDGKPLQPGTPAANAAIAAAQAAAGRTSDGAPPEFAAARGGMAGSARRAGAPAMPPLQLPPGFSISGVIRSGGISEAVVSFGALSGSLRPGDRGGHTTDLLPPGWSVASVDVNQGQLTLQNNGRRVTAQL